MPSQKDIFISAQMLIKQHGTQAEQYTQDMMQKTMNRDDVKGASVWLQIESAIEDLRSLKQQQGKLN